MELKDVLDDIQGDLPAVDASTQDSPAAPEPELEAEISPALLQSLENYKACMVYRKALEARPVLDKSLATEIFTMLPEMAEPLTLAKLTSSASAHNKSLITQKLDAYQPSPESMQPLYNQLYNVLDQTKQDCEMLRPIAEQVVQTLDAEHQRVKDSAVVVFCRKPYHLLTTPLWELIQIDDRLLDYPPYAGVLCQAIGKILDSNLYRDIYTEVTYHPSLTDIMGMLRQSLERITFIELHCEVLRKRLVGQTGEAFTQIDFCELTSQVKNIRQNKRKFVTETGLVDAVIAYLKLLS